MNYEQIWDDYSRWWDGPSGLSAQYQYLGDEWVDDTWARVMLDQFAIPYFTTASTVLELGPGGGRFTAELAQRSGFLICVDVSSLMLDRVRGRLGDQPHAFFLKGNGHDLAKIPNAYVDFIWTYNVFVQLQFEDIAGYLSEFKRVLKPSGVAAIHYATISTVEGWKYFQENRRTWREDPERRGRFCEMTFDSMNLLAQRYGLDLIANESIGRDAMLVVQKVTQRESRPAKEPAAIGESSAKATLSAAASKAMAKAQAAYEKGRLAEASVAIREALVYAPESVQLHACLGNILFQSADYLQAMEAYGRALALAPTNADILVRLAATALRCDDAGRFEQNLGRALDLEPENVAAIRLLADTNFKSRRFADAAAQYERLLQRTPDDPNLLIPAGNCRFHLGDLEGARRCFERVLKQDPQNATAAANLKVILEKASVTGPATADGTAA